MGKKKYYAVAVGRTTGLFYSWEHCEAQVKGYSQARFKSFKTKEEADAYLKEASAALPAGKKSDQRKETRKRLIKEEPVEASVPKKRPRPTTDTSISTFKNEGDDTIVPMPSVVEVSIQFDGGSRGNPGVAGAGASVIILGGNKTALDRFCKVIHVRDYLGHPYTNNQAEYRGLIAGLEILQHEIWVATSSGAPLELRRLKIQGDSKLVIQQMKGVWRCGAEGMIPLFGHARELLASLKRHCKIGLISLEHIMRAQNSVADGLANGAMDAGRSWKTTSNDNHTEQHEWSSSAAQLTKEANKSAGVRQITALRTNRY